MSWATICTTAPTENTVPEGDRDFEKDNNNNNNNNNKLKLITSKATNKLDLDSESLTATKIAMKNDCYRWNSR